MLSNCILDLSDFVPLLVYRKVQESSDNLADNHDPAEKLHHTLKLTDQYLALLLDVLVNAGLLEVGSPIPFLCKLLNEGSR